MKLTPAVKQAFLRAIAAPVLLAGLLLVLTACPPPTSITGVTIAAPTTLTSGETVGLTATVQGRGTFNPGVSWSVEGGGSLADATANPVDYTAPEVTAETTVRIKATAVGDPSKFATAAITVQPQAPLVVKVNPEVTPSQPTIPDQDGQPRPVGASRDDRGIQTDFVIGELLIRPADEAALQAFLTRYGAVVIGDNSVPEPPESLGLTLTPEERSATAYLVRFDLAALDLSGLPEDAAQVGLAGLLELSSEDALRTLAGITSAAAVGFDVSPNFAYYPDQAFPTPLFRTNERGGADAFTTPPFQTTGSQSNVTLAWQFIAARGIERRVRVAVIDGGFWLDAAGNPLTAPGDGSDLPQNPVQYDFVGDDFIAGAMNPAACTGGTPCPWHGNASVGVATGLVNNNAAAAGTGGLVADPMLFHTDIRDRGQRDRAIRTAVLWRADVINMSFSGPCNYWCRWDERLSDTDEMFQDANARGVVLVASAGNSGIDVIGDNYIRPCLNSSVICVGALADGGNTAFDTRPAGGWASNFGGGVDIWAPTNINVMADGASGGNLFPASGTSASAPFVAGVAAMMKAVNPNLNSDQVNQILRDTAHEGAAPVTHYIDAYAAVRKAAEGIDGVKDRFEPNGPTMPSPLTGAGPWNDLNLHNAQDRDYYRFSSPQRATVRIDLAYPETLGQIPWLGLDGSDACGVPTQTLDTSLDGGGRRSEYTVAAGPHVLGLGGGLINAYNLRVIISPTSAGLGPDAYETNDTPETARSIYSLRPWQSLFGPLFGIDPRVTIEATLHTGDDVDYYIIRAADPTVSELVMLAPFPVVKVYNNESPMTLEVNEFPSGIQAGRVSSQKCDGGELSVRLESGKSYLVRVTGGAGRYSLYNGIAGDERRLPILVRGRAYEVLNPLDPITRVLRRPLAFAYLGDWSARALRVQGAVRLALYDAEGALLAKGTPISGGERLDLAVTRHQGLYALEVSPSEPTAEGTAAVFSWEEAAPSRSSDNLIRNPGAEDGPGSREGGNVDYIPDWDLEFDTALATVLIYGAAEGFPTLDDPGPEDRGAQHFAGGLGRNYSSASQTVVIAPDWHAAVDAGRVKFNLSAFLGGYAAQADSAKVIVTFHDGVDRAVYRPLGQVVLGPVTPGERKETTGLYPVGAGDYVPATTRLVSVDLLFVRAEGNSNDGYADNLELILREYAQD